MDRAGSDAGPFFLSRRLADKPLLFNTLHKPRAVKREHAV